MLETLLKKKTFPSPLILEGDDLADWLKKIALYTLCETESACETCRSCKKVLKGFHPDWINLKGDLKMEDLRGAMHQLKQKPFESKKRFFSIFEAQETSTHIQNALLKTLEEPLSHWVLVLAVNSKWSLIETIRSRCLFYKVPHEKNNFELKTDEQNLFDALTEIDEVKIQQTIEPLLKERQKAKVLFQNLLRAASQQKYPGHWKKLAPHLESLIPSIDRNLNPRIIWDSAWSKSQTSTL